MKLDKGPIGPDGPIKTLVVHENFEHVFLLNNFGSEIGRIYQEIIDADSTLVEVDLDSPTDYEKVFHAADSALNEIVRLYPLSQSELCIHLSPGTPTMAAIWVLLGKGKFPATFYQTHKGKVIPTSIPFNLTVDFLPFLMKQPDIAFQHLAEQSPEEIDGSEKITGASHQIRVAAGRAKRAAIRDVPVLLIGESGTGSG